jgi:hypothetical protein
MSGGLMAVIQAISAKVGVAASPSWCAAWDTISVATGIVISDPLINSPFGAIRSR